jgi:hypothetical protein
MSKKIQLTVPEPCHENWDAMSPVEKGKFCGSCQKQVVDFSNMNDRQVAEFFKKPSTGSVCGRFMTDQLDREIEIPKKRLPFIKYFFQIALPAFLFAIKASAEKTQGQAKIKSVSNDTLPRQVYDDIKVLGMIKRPQEIKPVMTGTVVQTKQTQVPLKGEIRVVDTAVAPVKDPVCSREVMGKVAMPVDRNQNEIEGIVVNENNQPVPFASIQTNKRGEGLTADENGHFKIKKAWLSEGSTLTFSSAGYEAREITAGQEIYEAGKMYVYLAVNKAMEEVVLNSYNSYRVGMVMGSYTTVRRNTTVIPEQISKEPEGLKIYPNPVAPGSPITLSFKKSEEGYYQLMIVSMAGQTVQQNEIWLDEGARLLTVDAPAVAAGSYFMILTNKKTAKRFTEKIVISN